MFSEQTVKGVVSRLWDSGDLQDYGSDYGEPGYSLPAGRVGILSGDWNRLMRTHPRICRLLEDWYELEWLDEWWFDSDGLAWRTQADSYSWRSSIQWNDDWCDYMTPNDGLDVWVDWCADSPETRAITCPQFRPADLIRAGFVQWTDDWFENGWHPGQTDDPRKIVAQVRAVHGDDVRIVNILVGVGQFDIRWETYYQPKEG